MKVLDDFGNGTDSTVVAGLQWVAQNAAKLNIKVVAMSLGSGRPYYDGCGGKDVMMNAVCDLEAMGIVTVVAAGELSCLRLYGCVCVNVAESVVPVIT